ncbi:hypothetical protein HanXRQr2_Chr14g0650371 [Helianthus annuus]|uniref:Uncharacterized protein n=1 Tax=Helianthus annuus TaxID=4232 RepID=A0A251SHV7_HELAN|nr:hypothetical protein HanXRQr2_Chr14g0650371 [Helianthus annuus]KAJ0464596.1 hypothetical protein HanHA300_Chr14g0529111 [Helianthus annuus]KAJ0486194.1 hypothetical protein HanHA89_Chr14g0576991 [Helianthus annuus]KAJ0656742.1 hypothetical protein HanLR1_Chr14g0539361 [Helianthus annuus]KAJ0840859.1 hypothetical protein HanPSC8_Chr14g0623811 [Helianthus annuus]
MGPSLVHTNRIFIVNSVKSNLRKQGGLMGDILFLVLSQAVQDLTRIKFPTDGVLREMMDNPLLRWPRDVAGYATCL